MFPLALAEPAEVGPVVLMLEVEAAIAASCCDPKELCAVSWGGEMRGVLIDNEDPEPTE